MNTILSKTELRKKANKIRCSLNVAKLSREIIENIRKNTFYQQAQNVMLFYPLGHEVDLLSLLSDDKSFYLPKVNGKNLLVCQYKAQDELKISKFNTKEPIREAVSPEILDIIFVPALMVDKQGYRLGYGGGFYDRFLSKNCKVAKKIVPIFSALMVERLPFDEFDEKIDVTICETLFP